MRRRWQLILPAIGLILFGGVTYESVEGRKYEKVHGQYFWWASIRLDTHQIERTPDVAPPCKAQEDNCVSWEPHTIEDPGWLTRALIVSAFPPFLVGVPLVRVLGRYGANEVWSFMVLMPLLIATWYYILGLLLDRWIHSRARST
jgi:hypothetical protein